jgi:hypothetical protein
MLRRSDTQMHAHLLYPYSLSGKIDRTQVCGCRFVNYGGSVSSGWDIRECDRAHTVAPYGS